MKLTINNISQFFNLQRAHPNSLKPGMLYYFEYNAEDIHDKRPLVWILEVKNNRIWGLNLHYNFGILADIIQFKKQEIKIPNKEEIKKAQDEKLKKEKENAIETKSDLPTIVDAESKNSNISPSKTSLEDFSKYPMGKNTNILRNYLNKNIRNAYKLSLKI